MRCDLTEDFIRENIAHLNIVKVAAHNPVHKMQVVDWRSEHFLRKSVSQYVRDDEIFIRENAEYLDMDILSKCCRPDIIARNIDLPWTKTILSRHEYAGDEIMTIIAKFPGHLRELTCLTRVTHIDKIVDKYHDEIAGDPALIDAVCRNVHVSRACMRRHPDIAWQKPSVFRAAFHDECEQFTDLNASIYILSTKHITLEYAKNNRDSPMISWQSLSLSEVITIEEIMTNVDMPWHARFVSIRPDVTWQIIKKYPRYSWSFKDMFAHHGDNLRTITSKK